MPFIIPNTTTQDDFVETTTFAFGDVFASGFITVANNPVALQMAHGPRGQADWGPALYVNPSTFPLQAGGIDPVAGIRFRSFIAGSPAQVFGALFYPGEAAVLAGTPFTQSIAASGAVGAALEAPAVYDRSTSEVEVVGSIGETSIYSKTLTAADFSTISRFLMLRLAGDLLQNIGVASNPPRVKILLGAGTLLDSGPIAIGNLTSNAARRVWEAVIVIPNIANAATTQYITLHMKVGIDVAGSPPAVGIGSADTSENVYSYAATQQIDLTVTKDLEVRIINPSASASYSFRKRHGLLILS